MATTRKNGDINPPASTLRQDNHDNQDNQDNIAYSSNGNTTVTFEVIDQGLAARYLESNTENRHISDLSVAAHERDMREGEWGLINNGIGFAPDGTLVDGQHRLWAVFNSGVPIEVAVFRGIEKVDRARIDTNRVRTVNDELRIRGDAYRKSFASAAVLLMRYGIRQVGTYSAVKFSNAEVLRFIDQHREEMELHILPSVHLYSETKVPQSVGVACGVLFTRVDSGLCREFYERLTSGAGVDKGDPELALRNRVLKDREMFRGSVGQTFHFWGMVRSWNARRKGERLYRIQYPEAVSGSNMLVVR